jgi:glycosyltransferase involved in cell wall biosynthesis
MAADSPASDPRVTVVVPTFGRWAFMETALRSALGQRAVPVEVVVVADGPDAARWEEIPALHDARVRVLASPDGHGVADARNRGMAAARGQFVAFHDDDDIWSPDKLRLQLQAVDEQRADFAYTSGAILNRALRVRWIEPAPDPARLTADLIDNNPIPACSSNLVVRTDLARAVGFDAGLMHFADWDFAVRLIQSGRGAACGEVLVGYVWHGDNMHTVRLNGIESEFARFRGKHAAAGLRLGSPSQSRWVAGSYREAGDRARAAAAYLRGAIRYRSLPDLARAGGVLLGERAMRLASGSRRQRRPAGPEPAWLALYR